MVNNSRSNSYKIDPTVSSQMRSFNILHSILHRDCGEMSTRKYLGLIPLALVVIMHCLQESLTFKLLKTAVSSLRKTQPRTELYRLYAMEISTVNSLLDEGQGMVTIFQ